MVRDKNGILAEVNDENTVLSQSELTRDYTVFTINQNHYLRVYSFIPSVKSILGKVSGNAFKFFPIIFGNPEQANKILGTNMNGDLIWLDE